MEGLWRGRLEFVLEGVTFPVMPLDPSRQYQRMFAEFCARHELDPEGEDFVIPAPFAEEWSEQVHSLLHLMELSDPDASIARPNCPRCLTALNAAGDGSATRWVCASCGLISLS